MRSHAMLQIRFSRHRAGRITARWPLGRRIPTGLPVHLRNRHGVHRTGQLRRNLFELQRQGTVPRSDQQPEGPRLLSLHYWLGTFGELITREAARQKNTRRLFGRRVLHFGLRPINVLQYQGAQLPQPFRTMPRSTPSQLPSRFTSAAPYASPQWPRMLAKSSPPMTLYGVARSVSQIPTHSGQ